jgi:hypothetical protein
MLHDDVLLEIFDFYVDEEIEDQEEKQSMEAWQTLVHVCWRWRSLVFASPRRLDLRLVCTAGTSARDTLDVWPALPLEIQDDITSKRVDNIASVLKLRDRVCKVDLDCVTESKMEEICRVMEEPFPDLTDLRLGADPNAAPQLPDSFLGGSAPRLRSLILESIPFPALPNLLWSARHLVCLHFFGIPDSGYVSPEAMVTYLSMLTSLESLSLGSESYQPLPGPDSRPPHHTTRTVLSALTSFDYSGVSKYLEDFVARIDIPQLDDLQITIFEIDFDSTQLSQFISRTPTLKARDQALVEQYRGGARVEVPLFSQITGPSSGLFFVECPYDDFDEQLSALAWVCNSSLSLLSTVETLIICDDLHHFQLDDEESDDEWLELLSTFTAVKELFLSNGAVHLIAPALRHAGRGIQEVLPTLKHIGLEVCHPSFLDHVDVEDFYDARRHSDFKIEVSLWDRSGGRFLGGR